MPLYSYRCEKGHEFDKSGRIDGSDAPTSCPECQEPVQKIFALTARAFPGAGSWRKGMSSEK